MARPSNMSHQHLPPGASNGQYVKCVGGRIIWTTETPGGVVTEAGANAANAIGVAVPGIVRIVWKRKKRG